MTGPVEETALTSVLRHHNPQLDIRAVDSLAEMESFGPALLRRARLIGFVTPVAGTGSARPRQRKAGPPTASVAGPVTAQSPRPHQLLLWRGGHRESPFGCVHGERIERLSPELIRINARFVDPVI